MQLPHLSSGAGEKLVGHQDALKKLRSLYTAGNLAPCWLLVGQRGIGKGAFAYQFAKEILTSNPQNPTGLPENIVSRQIKVGSYPNLLVIEKALNKEGEELSLIHI
jgi:DNA polymerase III gamma/tau subunit